MISFKLYDDLKLNLFIYGVNIIAMHSLTYMGFKYREGEQFGAWERLRCIPIRSGKEESMSLLQKYYNEGKVLLLL